MSAPVIIGNATLYLGDCRDVMRTLPADSVDAIVCDPPYGLAFMGKGWDHAVPGVDYWTEALRVAKPGAHLLAFGGTRTFHRMVCAIEDAGWEIRDRILWLYGSGFPKSLDVSKAIDKAAGAEREVISERHTGWTGTLGGKGALGGLGDSADVRRVTAPASDAAHQWQGWGTALKPAHEPVIVARKPLVGTVAENVEAHGTGALNIDACRVDGGHIASAAGTRRSGGIMGQASPLGGWEPQHSGRWPANVIHDGSEEVLAGFPSAPGQLGPISSSAPSEKTSNVYGRMKREGEASADSENGGDVGFKMRPGARRLDTGSAARFFYAAKASKADRNDGCDQLRLQPSYMVENGSKTAAAANGVRYDRTTMQRNNHPTVKPTDLMRYLCRLVTPPGGVVLDPFTGSGSTGRGAIAEGFSFIGIELDSAYLAIAQARITASQAEAEAERVAAEDSARQQRMFA